MPASLSRRDGPIRLGGLAMLGSGVFALGLLFGGTVVPAGWAGFAAAGWGFLGCSGGALLTCLGAHVHDRVPISRPWAPHLVD
ncbi:hypothetical protein [uncultured Sphingomonas sp.]|uniref:hypothetical protein n=1 Tax=uncultured Sphingomonas sp. TaxID=158754 RepID=UPI0035C9B59C